MPRLLLHVGHLVTVEELREAANLIIHHTASVLPSAAQRSQEQLTVFGVTPQLRRWNTLNRLKRGFQVLVSVHVHTTLLRSVPAGASLHCGYIEQNDVLLFLITLRGKTRL